jgi:transglutaminase-like putative cysteine protease
LDAPLYLPAPLRASLTAGALHPGAVVEALVFDPTALKNDTMRITVVARERVPDGTKHAWHVIEEFRGVRTDAWIDALGEVLREEGPLGLVLVREPAEEAVAEGWGSDAALDVTASVAVPVAQPIVHARERMTLRLRLSGINVDSVPSDTDQVREGSVVTITRPARSSLTSYRLPYHDEEHTEDMRPTSFLQSDHPRIRAAARTVLGDEQDAVRAVGRLNDWVYETLRKVPTVSVPNALQVLEMGEGDCNEHAVLLTAMARAAGIPARVIAGAVYLDGAFLYHAWVEIWLGRWVAVDPTFRQFPADATHVKFVVGGPENHVAMVSVIGRLHIDVLDTPG